MRYAPETDRWDDPEIPRLADPELRSRLIGFLGCGWISRPGCRTDGTWVWPESLAARVRMYGSGPRQELLDHIIAGGILIPTRVANEAMLDAMSPDPQPQPVEAVGGQYFGVAAAGPGVPTDLLRVRGAAAEGWAPDGAWLTATGWRGENGGPLPAGTTRHTVPTRELSAREAADLADQLSRDWFEELRGGSRESDSPGYGPRVARVYDTVTPTGQPAVSPGRLRIVGSERRARLVHYLNQGRLVLRATGRMPDPLTGGPAPTVPLSFRTDGVWVWPDAVAYYLDTRGIAPELEFLCHIEEQGCLPPESVADDAARQAGIVATRPVAPRQRTVPRYHRSRAGDLFRQRGHQARPELLGTDLRWHRCPADWILPWPELAEIGETEAAREIDARWARTAD